VKFVPNDREKVSNDVITVALDMFLKDGFAQVKMDDVAARLSISKRTLYEMFPSKESLILECAKEFQKRVESRMELELGNDNDVISITLHHFSFIIEMSKNVNTSFFLGEMEKYPSVREYFKWRAKHINEKIRSFLELGVKQGLLRDDINMELVMQVINELGKLIARNKSSKQFTLEELFDSMILVFIRGIATEKGIEVINKQRTIFNN
jgi:AcrR family transcriptional regulator